MTMSSLYKLVQQAKKGDETATSKVVSLFIPKVKKESQLAHSFEEREDLEQELQIQILKAINRFDTSAPGFWDLIKK